ncbi:hypothetical protein EXIGLDRAFT_759379 [Exidia glandulosa HHB12029]|uniref:Uncharacterized protein n=1 Tax=Exidia glandulosa HHB12029 TaxID=1314781 RepID=A0A165Q4K6_EXIGL|nr:hypothetical protein EXIGLDRAFT_759379 [Exidia glandulosa HHB12029]
MQTSIVISYYRSPSLHNTTTHLWKMQPSTANNNPNTHTVTDNGVVKYLTNMLHLAKKVQEKEDVAPSKPLPPNPLPPLSTAGSTAATATAKLIKKLEEDEYETTESSLRWARGEDFTIDGFIALSQPLSTEAEEDSESQI